MARALILDSEALNALARASERPALVVSGNLSPASCSVAAVVVEQSAEARPASDHAERPVVVAQRPLGLMIWLPMPW